MHIAKYVIHPNLNPTRTRQEPNQNSTQTVPKLNPNMTQTRLKVNPYWSRIQPELDPNPTRTSFCIYQTVIEENMPSVREEVSEEWKDKLGVKVVPPLFSQTSAFLPQQNWVAYFRQKWWMRLFTDAAIADVGK